MEHGGDDASEIAARLRAHQIFYSRYLLDGQDPPAIIETGPAMGDVWSDIIGTSTGTHYGRAFAFHHQAQQQDWPAAWGQIDAPVLIVMGEYDWFENRAGHETVVRCLNLRCPRRVNLGLQPDRVHLFCVAKKDGTRKKANPDAWPAYGRCPRLHGRRW